MSINRFLIMIFFLHATHYNSYLLRHQSMKQSIETRKADLHNPLEMLTFATKATDICKQFQGLTESAYPKNELAET